MKKKFVFTILLVSFFFFVFKPINVEAKEIITKRSTTNIFGDTLGVVSIYDNGEIVVDYKYGLKQVDVFYCLKGNACDNADYTTKSVLYSTSTNMNKNTSEEMDSFKYNVKVSNKGEYRVRVEAYFGTSNSYDATSYMYISSKQTVDTYDTYLTIGATNDLNAEGMNKTMEQIVEIINTIVLPILYGLISIVLVIKGALIGTAIVKNADNPMLRQEKIKSLIWLLIGVTVAYAASTVIGALTGFFEDFFN